MALIETAERLLPSRLRGLVAPVTGRLGAILSGNDERAAAQRMALIAFAIRVASAAIAFVAQIIQARIMGEFEYGIFVFVWVMVILFGNLSCLGFHSAVIRFLPHYSGAGAMDEIRGLTATARLFAMLSASLLALAGYGVLHVAGDAIEPYYMLPVFLGLFILPMVALGDVLDGTARAHSWALVALSPTYIIRPTLILVFNLIAIAFGASHTAETAMLAALAATYVTTLGQFLAVRIRLRERYARGPLKIEFGPWLRVALPIFVIEGFGFLLTNSDVVVVGMFVDPQHLAVYFAATKTMALVQFVYFSVKAAAAPRFSALFAAGDRAGLAGFAGETVRWSFWPSVAVGLGLLVCGKLLLGLFGLAFAEQGYPLMAILFCGILAKALVGPGEVLLTMAGRQALCVWLYAAALAVNIALNVTLIPLFGLTGAAMAAAGAMLAEALLLHVAVRRALGIVLFAFADPLAIMNTNKAA